MATKAQIKAKRDRELAARRKAGNLKGAQVRKARAHVLKVVRWWFQDRNPPPWLRDKAPSPNWPERLDKAARTMLTAETERKADRVQSRKTTR